MCLQSKEPRLSRYLPFFFWESSNLFEIFTLFWKFFNLSRNLPDCLEINPTVQKSWGLSINFCRLSGYLPDFGTFSRLSRNISHYPEIFQTVGKSSRLSRKFQDSPENFQTVQKSYRLLGNLPDCPSHFKGCKEIMQTVRKFWRFSINLPDCLEIFQTVQKYSKIGFHSEIVFE